MKQSIFWNRRSGSDRRYVRTDPAQYLRGDDRRTIDRRLYGENGYMLVIGHTGVDRFTLLVTMPALLLAAAALITSSLVIF